MTFDNFVANTYDQNNVWITLVLGITMLALIVAVIEGMSLYFESYKRKHLILVLSCAALFIGGLFVASSISNASYAIDHLNEKIAEDNLKKKYDIVAVIWDENRTKPQTYDSLDIVAVQDSNSNVIEFKYRVDKWTKEPFLINDPEKPVKVEANDLLKEKPAK